MIGQSRRRFSVGYLPTRKISRYWVWGKYPMLDCVCRPLLGKRASGRNGCSPMGSSAPAQDVAGGGLGSHHAPSVRFLPSQTWVAICAGQSSPMNICPQGQAFMPSSIGVASRTQVWGSACSLSHVGQMT